jgi:hypothetical protein
MGDQKVEHEIHLPMPHEKQVAFIRSKAKRKMVKAGRRGGKTVGSSILGVEYFLSARRVLYAAPTQEQVTRFWFEVTSALMQPVKAGIFYKNESEKFIDLRGTEQRIKAKTAWNADTLRGDYADLLILDEFQLMNEDTWGLVGAPMLLDNDGDAVFIYTPPSLKSRSVSKANNPQHAAKMFKRFEELIRLGSTRHAVFHFKSTDNPHLSKTALDEITQDMTSIGYRMEILAEDVDEAPGALWTRQIIEENRVLKAPDYLPRIIVGVDPSATSIGDEAGIIVGGWIGDEGYLLADESVQGSPLTWADRAITAYHENKADMIVAEANNGGEMVEVTIHHIDSTVPVVLVHASRGKRTRAEPISALYEKKKIHHVGKFDMLEDEMCLWVPGDDSPNRMDAAVWTFSKLAFSGDVGHVDSAPAIASNMDW